MLHCPTCGTAARLSQKVLDERDLTGLQCGWCGGTWIRLKAHAPWLRTGNLRLMAALRTVELDQSRPDVFHRRCPECQIGLGYERISGVSSAVVRCPHCRGAWLDGYDWSALREQGLHAMLQRIFGSELHHNLPTPAEDRSRIVIELL